MKTCPRFEDFFESFWSFEKDHGLFDWKIGDAYPWDYILSSVYYDICHKIGLIQVQPAPKKTAYDRFRKVLSRMVFSITRNPVVNASGKDILFMGNSRRKRLQDGRYYDIYSDFFIDDLPFSYEYFHADTIPLTGYDTKTKSIKTLDYLYLGSFFHKLFKGRRLGPKDMHKIKSLSESFILEYGADPCLMEKVQNLMEQRLGYEWIAKRLLDTYRPKMVVETISKSVLTGVLNEECRRREIPTVELQVCEMSPIHIDYNFPDLDRKVTNAPDYILLFNSVSDRRINLPVDEDKAIVTGFPYFDDQYQRYKDMGKKDRIVVVSQWTYGKQLSDLALDISKRTDGFEVVFKLHPAESGDWQGRYPQLVDSDIRVVGDQIPLYELLGSSKALVGVYSTVLGEGIAFNMKVYLYDIDGTAWFDYLVDMGYAKVIGDAGELVADLDKDAGSRSGRRYYRENAKKNIIDAISGIIAKEGPADA